MQEKILIILNEYCDSLITEIKDNGPSDKVNEGIRMLHHLIKIKDEVKK